MAKTQKSWETLLVTIRNFQNFTLAILTFNELNRFNKLLEKIYTGDFKTFQLYIIILIKIYCSISEKVNATKAAVTTSEIDEQDNKHKKLNICSNSNFFKLLLLLVSYR